MGFRTKAKTFVIRVLSKKQMADQLAYWEHLYGDFDKRNYETYRVNNLPSESGFYHGEMIKWATELRPNRVLFVGENKQTALSLKQIINAKEVYTTGLSNADYLWNFEEDPPSMENKFDLIISQAILEHLINPYKHVQDITSFIKNEGHIIIHTVMPGFHYHRYPIDALRFYPDWFEELSERLGMTVLKKRINDTHIFYMLTKAYQEISSSD